jgi:threonine/homoserine/homoserine lactone efflux protein
MTLEALMNTVLATSGLIFTAAITPGPNNFLVLKLAGQRNLRSVLMPIGGMVAGGLAMIALAQLGLAVVTSRHTWVRESVVICGTLYLVVLGLLLVQRSFRTVSMPTERAREAPIGALALFVFQFLNPKAWVLVLTVSAATGCVGQCARQWPMPMITLLLLFAAISSACLLAWAVLGRLAARFLPHERLRARFDCAMGLSLVACAGSLLFSRGPT